MDYEKAYIEALERAKVWQNHLYDTNDKDYADELNYIFPELKESEDEKIRKALVRFHKSTIDVDGIKGEDIIAWLEKQGEQKPFDYENATIQQKDFSPKYPKFKVGDWVVDEEDNHAYKVERVVTNVSNGLSSYDLTDNGYFYSTKTNYHLWCIEDAKDGDVLYSPCCKLLWIYKDEKTCYVGSNLNYNSGSIVINKSVCIPTDVIPATKRQRDLLFQKMEEAGYSWNPITKELSQISVTKKSDKVWSDEDERLCQCLINDQEESLNDVRNDKYGHTEIRSDLKETYRERMNWLKSIKQRLS